MLRKKLEEQLKLLKNSSELYDKGRVEEALNIAIRLRVILYDNPNNKNSKNNSLLKKLNQKDTIKLLSTLEDNSQHPVMKNINVQFAIPIMHTSNGQKPYLDTSPKKDFMLVEEWLNEIVITIEGQAYTRYDIIKATAHKDGGAHIEIDHKDIKPFTSKFGICTIKENNSSITQDISNHHYILLRQFAYEVLHSEELYITNSLNYTPMQKIKSYNEYLSDGDNFQNKKEYYKANKAYEKAIDVNPDNCKFAYNNNGNALVQLGEIEEAITCYKNAISQGSSYIDALYNLSIRYEKLKRYDLTIDLYERILKIDENHKLARNNFTSTINILSDLKDEIIYQYSIHSKNKPKNLTYIGLLGVGLLKFNCFLEAEIFYTYSLSIYSDNNMFIYNLCYSLYKQEKYNEADILSKKLIELNTLEFEILINIIEFKLITDASNNKKAMEQFKDKFNKENMIYYELFTILFNAKNGQDVKIDILKFNEIYLNKNLAYDFSDILKWVSENNISKDILIFLENFQISNYTCRKNGT